MGEETRTGILKFNHGLLGFHGWAKRPGFIRVIRPIRGQKVCGSDEAAAEQIIVEDGFAPVPAIQDMVHDARMLDANCAGDAGRLKEAI